MMLAARGLSVAVLLAGVPTTAVAADLLIRNARLIDGTGAAPREGVAILVRDGRIAQIEHSAATAVDVPVLDAAGDGPPWTDRRPHALFRHSRYGDSP